MKLHKAFSSLINFPLIKNDDKKYFRNSNIHKKDFFLTLNIADDDNFARSINNKFEKKLIMNKMNNLRIWKKGKNNDIYSPNWTSNKNILRNIKNKLNLETNDLCLNNLDKISYRKIFKTQSNNIFNSYLTAKNYKFLNQLKSKYFNLNTNLEKLSSNSKKLCFDNYISNLLNHERNKISNNEKEFKNAIKKENLILNNDIKKFENFQVHQNLKFRNSDKEVQKFIKANSLIYEIVKGNMLEYHSILNKIQHIIKEIYKLEEYVLYVYQILEIDTKDFKELEGHKIIKNPTNQIETEKNINNIFMHSKILFNKTFKNILDELTLDVDKIYLSINNKEKIILKKLEENEDIKRSRFKLQNEFEREMKNHEKKYDNYMSEYISLLNYYEEEIEKYNLNEKNTQFSDDFQNYIYYLSQIKDVLLDKEEKKQINTPINLTFGNIIIPCLEEVKRKEFFVEAIIKKMEFLEQNDPILFNKCIYNIKLNNRTKKLKKEKKLMKLKEIEEKLKIIEKHKKIIIQNKYRYNLPSHHRIKESFSDSKIKTNQNLNS